MIGTVAAIIGIAYGYVTYHNKKLGENEGWDTKKWSPFRRAAAKQFAIDSALADGSIKAGGWLGDYGIGGKIASSRAICRQSMPRSPSGQVRIPWRTQ